MSVLKMHENEDDGDLILRMKNLCIRQHTDKQDKSFDKYNKQISREGMPFSTHLTL